MAIQIKSTTEIAKIRYASQCSAEILTMLNDVIKPGITTIELDTICHQHIVERGNIPACLNYHGFPKSICTSVNHVVCHGIPGSKKLKKGDIINVDITIKADGYHGDTSKMYFVGQPTPLAKRLVTVTQECLYQAIQIVKPGIRLGDIGFTIQRHAEKNHYSVVREYCGHGIGRLFHEPNSDILHYGRANTGSTLEEGMVFTIEPMINAGHHAIKLLSDGWTVVTKDRQLSAQWEHTILVTKTGYEILSLREEEKQGTFHSLLT